VFEICLSLFCYADVALSGGFPIKYARTYIERPPWSGSSQKQLGTHGKREVGRHRLFLLLVLPPPGQPRTMVGKPLAQQLRVEHRKAEGGQPEEENSHCRKKASPTCREHPFSVLACPMVIFRRKRSLVSTTGRKQITHSIDKCDWSRRPMLRK
jgi:hypothetical protein